MIIKKLTHSFSKQAVGGRGNEGGRGGRKGSKGIRRLSRGYKGCQRGKRRLSEGELKVVRGGIDGCQSTHEHSLAFMTIVPWHHERS